MQPERRRIQNLAEYIRWTVFAETVNDLKSLTGHGNILDIYDSAEK